MWCLESEKEMASTWNTKLGWRHFHIKHSTRHFAGVLAAQVSQSCISLFTVRGTRWQWHQEVLSRHRGWWLPSKMDKVKHRLLCPRFLSPGRQLGACSPHPWAVQRQQELQSELHQLGHTAETTCAAETEAAVVKSTCSISRLHRATQPSD